MCGCERVVTGVGATACFFLMKNCIPRNVCILMRAYLVCLFHCCCCSGCSSPVTATLPVGDAGVHMHTISRCDAGFVYIHKQIYIIRTCVNVLLQGKMHDYVTLQIDN